MSQFIWNLLQVCLVVSNTAQGAQLVSACQQSRRRFVAGGHVIDTAIRVVFATLIWMDPTLVQAMSTFCNQCAVPLPTAATVAVVSVETTEDREEAVTVPVMLVKAFDAAEQLRPKLLRARQLVKSSTEAHNSSVDPDFQILQCTKLAKMLLQFNLAPTDDTKDSRHSQEAKFAAVVHFVSCNVDIKAIEALLTHRRKMAEKKIEALRLLQLKLEPSSIYSVQGKFVLTLSFGEQTGVVCLGVRLCMFI